MTKRVCGIDPGLSGALAFADLDESGAVVGAWVRDMPVSDAVDGRPAPCAVGVADILREETPGLIVIEHVEPRPRSGATSEWRFASGFGATLAACRITAPGRTHLVRPRIWKSALDLSSDKSQSLSLARSLHPGLAADLARQKDDGRAEALLLIEYLRQVLFARGEMEVC